MVRARSRLRPGSWVRASTQARGTPNTSERPVAHREQTSDSLRASTATGLVRSDQRVDQGVFVRSPTSGMARNPTVRVAMASTKTGGLRRRVGVVMEPQAGRKLSWCSTFCPVGPARRQSRPGPAPCPWST